MNKLIAALIIASLAIPAAAAPKPKPKRRSTLPELDRQFCTDLGGRYKIKKGKTLCVFNDTQACTITQLKAHTCRIPMPAKLEACKTAADCAPDGCCHPKGCIASANPNLYSYQLCFNLACSGDCRPGTLDCGQATCQCIEGKCAALPTVTAPK